MGISALDIEDQSSLSQYLKNSKLIGRLRPWAAFLFRGPDNQDFVIKTSGCRWYHQSAAEPPCIDFPTRYKVRRELVGYKIADFVGVNTTRVRFIDRDLTGLLHFNKPLIDNNPSDSLILQPISDVTESDLKQRLYDGLEEAVVFTHLTGHSDLNTRTEDNLCRVGTRSLLYDFGDLDAYCDDYGGDIEVELVTNWIHSILDIDLGRLSNVLRNLESQRSEYEKLLQSCMPIIQDDDISKLMNRFGGVRKRLLDALSLVHKVGYFVDDNFAMNAGEHEELFYYLEPPNRSEEKYERLNEMIEFLYSN